MKERPQIRPSIPRLQKEFSERVARRFNYRRYRERRPDTPSKITDNSVPWVENPQSVDDLCEIAASVQKLMDQWGPQRVNSSKP
jgi:hypothetical protein